MKVYLELIKIAFQTRAAYRMEVALRLIRQVVAVFIQAAIWQALLGVAGATTSSEGVVTLREMVTYVIVSGGMSVLLTNNVLYRIDTKIKTGEIAMDLIKPLELKAYLFCEALGTSGFDFNFVLLPLLGISAIVFGLNFPPWWNILVFVVALVNGFVIQFLIAYILGLTGFWYLEVWHWGRFLDDLIRLFSGSWIPLWFFPSFLIGVSMFLPFRFIYFVPLSIYLGKIGGLTDIVWLILQQLIWISILLVVEKLLWIKGIKKVIIQGG